MKLFFLLGCLPSFALAHAQQDSLPAKAITVSAYAELYYGFDFGNPSDHLRPGFVYSHKRHNEAALNLALVKATFAQGRYRANLGLMAGNYAQYNLAAEPVYAQFVYEANAGIKLSAKKEIWLDAGIMPSHIGFESAIGADCWTLTRSMAADNSPYYEAGIKLSTTSANGKLGTALLLLNGWQRVQRPDGINRPSFGMQLNYKPHDKLSLNYSNFIGSDKPDSLHAWRIFHNLYAQYDKGNWGIIAGLDMGTDRAADGQYALWYTPVLIARIALAQNHFLAARAEYYNDTKQLIIGSNSPRGFQTFGASLNYDIKMGKHLLWRIEGKWYQSKDPIFTKGTRAVKDNQAVSTSLSVRW
jgi:Putative beta-barrel porin-2, OmpL-like. bbp2